jgi:hypothetical protein
MHDLWIMIRIFCFLHGMTWHGMTWHGMRADATLTAAASACVRRDLGTRAEGGRVTSGVRPISEEPEERGREKGRGMTVCQLECRGRGGVIGCRVIGVEWVGACL